VADYDTIVVMDGGIVAEIGSPFELLTQRSGDSSRSTSSSLFEGLVNELGPERKANFLEIATSRQTDKTATKASL
jgi:hypothetical protein